MFFFFDILLKTILIPLFIKRQKGSLGAELILKAIFKQTEHRAVQKPQAERTSWSTCQDVTAKRTKNALLDFLFVFFVSFFIYFKFLL